MYNILKSENGEITTTHLLLGIWSEKESAGHKIMAALGFDDEKAKEIAKSVSYVLGLDWEKFWSVVTCFVSLGPSQNRCLEAAGNHLNDKRLWIGIGIYYAD
ncbi:hypothetical protein CsSME_00001550 [Camellia sinensis var. sinensis]